MSSSCILCNNDKLFLNWILTCNKKWIVYNNCQWPAQWLEREAAPKHFSKPNLHQKKKKKKRTWSLFGGLLLLWSTTAFWVPVKPLHLRSMLSKSMGCTELWNTYRYIGQQNGPNSSPWQCPTACRTTNVSKVEQTGLGSFASSTIFTWSLVNWLSLPQAFQQLFAGKKLLQPAGCRKHFPRVHWVPEADFYATGISKLNSHWQKSVDCNGSYFD